MVVDNNIIFIMLILDQIINSSSPKDVGSYIFTDCKQPTRGLHKFKGKLVQDTSSKSVS